MSLNVLAVGVRCRLWNTKLSLKTKFDMENKTSTNHENGNDANRLLAAVLSKLDEMIVQSEESAKIFEQHNMVASELTSGAMAQAYKNVKQWILNGC